MAFSFSLKDHQSYIPGFLYLHSHLPRSVLPSVEVHLLSELLQLRHLLSLISHQHLEAYYLNTHMFPVHS